ncbi:Inner membrane protein yccF [Citrobacter freundii]|nr:Inner membrane protein yccF [Citrobacter freundii]
MRTVLNILNFVLGGFATTLAWLLATLVSIVLIFTLPLTRSCWGDNPTFAVSLWQRSNTCR